MGAGACVSSNLSTETAIALGQSNIWFAKHLSIAPRGRRQTMHWKHLAIAPRRKAIATALLYGLSLTVRFTSPTAEEAPVPTAQSANPATAILINQGWPRKPMVPVALRGWPSGPRSCQAACEGPSLLSSLPNCSAP
ncbi:hypothetical protein GWG65_12940 [Bradyrhizobium sp. CSA207]|nr:hypothetical protein [Bradyrhizobium sp. CSA207]